MAHCIGAKCICPFEGTSRADYWPPRFRTFYQWISCPIRHIQLSISFERGQPNASGTLNQPRAAFCEHDPALLKCPIFVPHIKCFAIVLLYVYVLLKRSIKRNIKKNVKKYNVPNGNFKFKNFNK